MVKRGKLKSKTIVIISLDCDIHMSAVPGTITFSCQSATSILDAALIIRSLYRFKLVAWHSGRTSVSGR